MFFFLGIPKTPGHSTTQKKCRINKHRLNTSQYLKKQKRIFGGDFLNPLRACTRVSLRVHSVVAVCGLMTDARGMSSRNQ